MNNSTGAMAASDTKTGSPDEDEIVPIPASQWNRVEFKPQRTDWWSGHRGSTPSKRRPSLQLRRRDTVTRHWWIFTLRDWDDDDEQDWWFASTAIPLLAATFGPLANVTSIAALVTYWRMCLNVPVSELEAAVCPWNGTAEAMASWQPMNGQTYADPHWCFYLNLVSLVFGFVGNFFLLCNFTNRIRYIIALPVTILCWYAATAILLGITASMAIYVPPISPQQTYSQGFWYGVLAAILYCICSMLLMVNMWGFFLGHYPQHFTLTESQRTLILQTMLFFIWLAGGAGVFQAVEKYKPGDPFEFSYVNALYFCDVTILTVGFGDLYPETDAGRGLVFPYSVGGIIMLGLMVSSITKFVAELSSEKVIQAHVEKSRTRTMERARTRSIDLQDNPSISAPSNPVPRARTVQYADEDSDPKLSPLSRTNTAKGAAIQTLRRAATIMQPRKPKLILLREEKDRFDAMREIQRGTSHFKRWSALFASTTAFGTLWCVGALVFWQCEKDVQDMTYFKALYFAYVSLLTIGYGDLAPKSNPGRPFFVVWSLLAVPTMSILVSNLGDTVISKFKNGTNSFADFSVLPKKGIWHNLLKRYPWLLNWWMRKKQKHDAKKRMEEGFKPGPLPETEESPPTLDELAAETLDNHELARRLAKAIRRTAKIARDDPGKRYEYEEWVEFTQLIRFTAKRDGDGNHDEEEGLIEWDWIGEDSPMMAKGSEPEFVLDRLCESMHRYIRNVSIKLPDDTSDSNADTLVKRRTFGDGDSSEPSLQRRVSDREIGPLDDDIPPDESEKQ